MYINDLRKSPRRSLTTRVDERRKVTNEFGLSEWLKSIKINYVDYPKFNRRKIERRTDKRRLPDRREQCASEPILFNKKHAPIFLTRAERKLIEDLYLIDLE